MRLPFVLSILMICTGGYSQVAVPKSVAADTSVDFVARWRLGETRSYSIIHEKKTIKPAGKTPPFKFAYEAQISVIDSTEKSYILKWVFHLPEEFKALHPFLADSMTVYNGMQMIFKTTEMGAFVELLNWEAVRDAYTRMMEIQLPKTRDSATTAALEAAKNMFNSKETVETAMIREIQLFHVPYGYKFSTRQAPSATEISNPFGGDPFPATQTVEISQIKPKTDEFSLVFHLQTDKVKIKNFVESMLKKLNIRGDRDVQKIQEQYSSFDLHDFTEYRFVRSNGWIKQLYYERIVNMEGTTRSDSYTITSKE